MQRVTFRLPRHQARELEAVVDAGEYSNRSEVIRAAIRELLKKERERTGQRRYAPMPGGDD